MQKLTLSARLRLLGLGDVQVIMFVAEPGSSQTDETAAAKGVAGYYRSGSDFRKDGQAVGLVVLRHGQ